jgi:hypothetical protein
MPAVIEKPVVVVEDGFEPDPLRGAADGTGQEQVSAEAGIMDPNDIFWRQPESAGEKAIETLGREFAT